MDQHGPLKLAKGLSLPLDAITQTIAFLARRGAGKTYAAGRLCEQMLSQRAQVIIVDPVGVWWGLRLSKDEKSPSPFEIPVLGGLRLSRLRTGTGGELNLNTQRAVSL